MEEKVSMTFKLDESLRKEFKIYATMNDIDMADILVNYITDLLEKGGEYERGIG